MSLAIELRGISKRFGTVQALDSVDLTVEAGTIHAQVGENGAGKTTLMRILYGSLRPDSGTLAVAGAAHSFRSSSDAIRAGIGMVSQHPGIIPELTCLQNLMLGAEPTAWIDLSRARDRAETLARQMGFGFDWSASSEDLSPSATQKLEILKLLWRNARIMILDEPTAMLSPVDAEALFGCLRRLADGGATVLLVTHRLPEVLQYCRDVTVLRAGRMVSSVPVAATNGVDLAKLIVGGEPVPPLAHESPNSSEVALAVRGLSVGDRLAGVAFEIKRGEVVGIAGVDGSGQRELMRALAGAIPAVEGQITLFGNRLDSLSAAQRIEAGVRLIPEDRHAEGFIEDWSLEGNAALGLQRTGQVRRGRWIDLRGRRALATAVADRFQTQHAGLQLPIRTLSGGNQQRLLAARALSVAPRLILAFQPARGLDIDGTRQLYEAIRQECGKGAAAMVVSFDLDELLANCDRILVLSRGQLVAPAAGQELDRDAIGRLMVGAG